MNWQGFISQYDLVYETPPMCWQDGFVLGNGSLGAVFSAPHVLEWVVNKTDVIDGRVAGVREVIPPDVARQMVANGAETHDFERAERGLPLPEGAGPKSCCTLALDIGMFAGAGNRSAVPQVQSRLSLYDATLKIAIDKHLCHPRIESFVHATENLLVIQVRDVSPIVAFRSRVNFSRPMDVDIDTPVLIRDRERILLQAHMPEGVSYAAAIQIIPRESNAYRKDVLPRVRPQYCAPQLGAIEWRIQGQHALGMVGGDFDVFLVVVTSREADDPLAEAHRRLDAVVERSIRRLHAEHAAYWADFWRKSWVELGDKALDQLFYQSLYTLRTAYRLAPMSGLMGLCYGPSPGPVQITPWSGDLHHDQNVQCPFLPVHALNHSELFDAYIDTYASFLPEACRLARDIWQADGAHFDMTFTALGRSVKGGVGSYRFFYGGSYVAIMHCLCWRYRRDVGQLREHIYPFLREVLDFYRSIMRKGDDGLFHLWPGHTPELDIATTGDPVQNICMLRMCLRTAIEAANILGDGGPYVNEWQDMLDHLPAYPVHEEPAGRRVLDATNVPPDHHVSQICGLYPVYPCGEVDAMSPADQVALYSRTLDAALEQIALKSYAQADGFHFEVVWQCFFAAVSAIRLGRKDMYWNMFLPMFLRCYSKPNGLISHNATVIVDPKQSEANVMRLPDKTLEDVGRRMPIFEPWCGHSGGSSPDERAKAFSDPVIEGNADYLTMMVEALLQSQNGIIRLFPGWPDNRPAQFRGLIAEGNIQVSACRSSTEVTFITLDRVSDSSIEAVRVVSPWTGKVDMWDIPSAGLTLTRHGASTRQLPSPGESFEQAQPRILFDDAGIAIAIGRKGK